MPGPKGGMPGRDGARRYCERVPYTVRTPVFEGPFDLLLHLITREQVDLWEVSLTDIVDAYVASLQEMRHALDLEVATEFLLIASVLLELKARRLLPDREEVDPEDELALWEERDLLLARLLECKTSKDAAGAMLRLMDAADRCRPRVAGLDPRFQGLAPDLLAGVTAGTLHATMQALMQPRPAAQVLLDHVAPVRASVRDAVEELLDELPRAGRIAFSTLTSGLVERLEIIVRFLALLEMYKQGLVDLEQAATFSDLQVSWLGASGPAAEADRVLRMADAGSAGAADPGPPDPAEPGRLVDVEEYEG
jgi:segregation and condensation protein A